MRTTWTFHSAGQLVFGRYAVRQLGDLTGRLGAKRLLIVTDPTLVKVGILDQVRTPLIESGLTVEVFDGAESSLGRLAPPHWPVTPPPPQVWGITQGPQLRVPPQPLPC